MELPPFEAGASHETVALPSVPVPITFCGADGDVGTRMSADGDELSDVPNSFVAVTAKV
jgi:hypothetical protein